jgi:hypothetical protein
MNRSVDYFERAFRAYHHGDWVDLLLQLCPCIEAAAEHEYGHAGRTSFRKFVDDNLSKAMHLSGAPAIGKIYISIRTKNAFGREAIKALAKADISQPEHRIDDTTPAYLREILESENQRIRSEKIRHKEEGIYCVPIGHIMYHCLRCEYLHKPGSSGAIEFHDQSSIDNTNHEIKLPLRLLYGYILVTISSPAFIGRLDTCALTINWSQIKAESKICWIPGNRDNLMKLAELNQKCKHEV